MKDTASHRKRAKSESDSARQRKGNVDTGGSKSKHSGTGQTGSQQSPQQASHHGGHHDGHHGGNQQGGPDHHQSRTRKDTMSRGHHDGHHGGSQHGGHDDHHAMRPRRDTMSRGHHDGQHGGSQHGGHDDHHPYPMRPRRDTMMSRGHSTYHDDRRSTGTNEAPVPTIHYENTYKLTPDCRVHEGKIREIIKNAFEENLKEKVYDVKVCGQKCQFLTEVIKERVKKLNFNRFKIICIVMIGQVYDQSMLVTSRCLWDQRFDNSVSVEYQIGDVVAVGLVFAVYAE